VIAVVDIAALMMDELISKERRGVSAQRGGRMMANDCLNGDSEVIIGSLCASDG